MGSGRRGGGDGFALHGTSALSERRDVPLHSDAHVCESIRKVRPGVVIPQDSSKFRVAYSWTQRKATGIGRVDGEELVWRHGCKDT